MIDNIKQIIEIFRMIQENSGELQSFIYCPNSLLPNDLEFPFLQIYCTSAEKTYNGVDGYPNMSLTFYVRVADRHNDEDRIDVENSTHQILDAICNCLATDDYFINNDIKLMNSYITMFKEVDNTIHKTIGWSTTLTLQIANWGGGCGTTIDLSSLDNTKLPNEQ